MTINETRFRESLGDSVPPAGLTPALRALWHDFREDWHGAHAQVDDESSPSACRVHAYLHRKEGDPGNAGYWYRRAGVAPATQSLETERATLLRDLLTGP